MKRKGVLALLAMLAALSAPAANAAGDGGCDAFAWPVTTELAWMTAAPAERATSGATLPAPPDGTIEIALAPTDALRFDVAPSGAPKKIAPETYGGIVNFDEAPKAGIWQVSLSGPGWIDVVQNGATLATVAHTGKSDCAGLRKSVRFDIAAAPFALQLSSVPERTIRVTLRPAD